MSAFYDRPLRAISNRVRAQTDEDQTFYVSRYENKGQSHLRRYRRFTDSHKTTNSISKTTNSISKVKPLLNCYSFFFGFPPIYCLQVMGWVSESGLVQHSGLDYLPGAQDGVGGGKITQDCSVTWVCLKKTNWLGQKNPTAHPWFVHLTHNAPPGSFEHRLLEWVGRDLIDNLVPGDKGPLPPARGARSPVQPGLKHCQGGGSHSFSGQLCQGLTTLRVTNFFLVMHLLPFGQADGCPRWWSSAGKSVALNLSPLSTIYG